MNTQSQDFPGVDSLREWTRAILKGGAPAVVYHPGTDADALAIMKAALTLPKYFADRGYKCNVSGSTNVVLKGFGVTAGKVGFSTAASFKVMPVSKLKKGVTETSREAYRSLDPNAACVEVVKCAIETGETYDRDLASKLGRESGYVSARRNDLEKMGRFAFNGKEMAIEYTQKKPCKVTGKRVQWWRVVEVCNGQASLF